MSAKAAACLFAAPLFVAAARAQTSQEHPSEASSASSAPAKGPDLRRVEQLIIEKTNQFRHEQGRAPLHRNAQLGKAARAFAAYLARTGKFSHTADGKRPGDRTAAQGYAACIVAENIAWENDPAGFTTRRLADALVHGWENSPHHRKNMLDPDLEEIGVGVAYSEETGRYYAVQDFGRPKTDAIVFTISDDTTGAVQYTVDGKDFSIQPHYTMTHKRCRPGTLRFKLPGATAAAREYHPHTGAHYVIRAHADGRYTVAEE